jgi:hypothetical protein
MPVSVPNVIGMGRTTAEAALDAKLLRHMARFPFSAGGDGSATAQNPPAGALVPTYAIITVDYPSQMGPLPDSPVEGPTLQAGTYEGKLESVMAGNPWGTGQGAWITLKTQLKGHAASISATLYFDQIDAPAAPLERTEWMRRGAMLGVAQRAFTNGNKVRLVIASDLLVQSIEIYI